MLLLLVIASVMLLGSLGIVLMVSTGRAQKKSEQNAEKILDASFDGSPDVTVTVNMRTLKYETFVTGAKRRGYKLVDKAENKYGPHTLIFEKV